MKLAESVKCGMCVKLGEEIPYHANVAEVRECYFPSDDVPPTCRVCDGIGHGYPGAGPCPLEDAGWADRLEEYLSVAGL